MIQEKKNRLLIIKVLLNERLFSFYGCYLINTLEFLGHAPFLAQSSYMPV